MLQQINISTSKANKEVVRKLTNKLPVGTKENVIARIALSYSIQSGKKFSTGEFKDYDSQGKEYKDHILFDPVYREFYIALIAQHYQVYKTEESIRNYIKLHIDHGLELLNELLENSPNYTILDFLVENIERGISYLENVEVSLDAVANNNQNIFKSHFLNPIEITVGSEVDTGESIVVHPNNLSMYSNCHMAVAGQSGSGKTQFALEYLSQLTEKTNGQVNFLFVDFKGDKPSGDTFFKRSKAKFIDAPHDSFPVNPLSFIDSVNNKNRLMGINKFVDIISKYNPGMGKRQEQYLKDATIRAFDDCKSGEHPSFSAIYNYLIEAYEEKRDSLTKIIEDISELEVFEDNKEGFLNQNYYLSLSGDLSSEVRFTSLFLIINYVYNVFMNMESAPIENGHIGLRYVLLIDEAHVIFKEKKSQDILEKMLREIRSQGVSVMMLSQGIDEFVQPSFDFSSNCEISILLEIKDKGAIKKVSKFLGLGSGEHKRIARKMEIITRGMAVSNIKELPSCDLFSIIQNRPSYK